MWKACLSNSTRLDDAEMNERAEAELAFYNALSIGSPKGLIGEEGTSRVVSSDAMTNIEELPLPRPSMVPEIVPFVSNTSDVPPRISCKRRRSDAPAPPTSPTMPFPRPPSKRGESSAPSPPMHEADPSEPAPST